jgi:hypothetical protein
MTWRYITVWMELMFLRGLKKFGYKQNIDVIPKDTMYCYKWDEEKNANDPEGGWIITCPYYRLIQPMCYAACTYTGYIGFDPCLADQCKICGINEDERE